MHESSTLIKADKGIILAAGVVGLAELGALAATAVAIPEVVAIKIGFMLGLKHGLRKAVDTVNAVVDLPVIHDHHATAGPHF